MKGLGFDFADVRRFRGFRRTDPFIQKAFTKLEQDYCFSFKDPSPHLAGTFAAKEAGAKAMGAERIPLYTIEIRRHSSGRPEAWRNGKRLKNVLVSISHTKELAGAVAITTRIKK